MRRFLISMIGISISGICIARAATFDLEITTAELPWAVVGRPYAPEPLSATGGGACAENQVSFKLLWGDLPDGIRLTAAGYFSGTPRTIGTFPLLIMASNACGRFRKRLTLTVTGAPMLVVSPTDVTLHYRAGGPPPEPVTLVVASSWPDMAYSVQAPGSAWVSLRPLAGRTPFPGSALEGDPVEVTVDPRQLKPGHYRAIVRASAWESANHPVATVTLIVE